MLQDGNWIVGVDPETLQDSLALFPGFFGLLVDDLSTEVLDQDRSLTTVRNGSGERYASTINLRFVGVLSFIL